MHWAWVSTHLVVVSILSEQLVQEGVWGNECLRPQYSAHFCCLTSTCSGFLRWCCLVSVCYLLMFHLPVVNCQEPIWLNSRVNILEMSILQKVTLMTRGAFQEQMAKYLEKAPEQATYKLCWTKISRISFPRDFQLQRPLMGMQRNTTWRGIVQAEERYTRKTKKNADVEELPWTTIGGAQMGRVTQAPAVMETGTSVLSQKRQQMQLSWN